MFERKLYPLLVAVLVMVLATLACSIGGSKAPTTAPTLATAPTPTTAPAPTTAPTAVEEDVSSGEDVASEAESQVGKDRTSGDEELPDQVGDGTPTSIPEENDETPDEAVDETVVVEDPVEEAAPESIFPLPDDVHTFMELGDGGEAVNFQTNMTQEETIEFYRQAFADMGLTERPLLTVIEDEVFSMVFDGWQDGRSVVIQGVDLGDTFNVNIRLEDV